MPVIPVSEIETQPESRASVLSNGRRRRRRSRGGQRPGAPALDGTMPLDESGDDVEELELAELILPDLSFDDQPDEVFEAPIEPVDAPADLRSEDHTSELQSRGHLLCRLLLEEKLY